MSKPRVIVTRRWPEPVEAALAERFDAQLNPDDRPFTKEELTEALKSADALLPTVTDKITADVFPTDGLRAKLIANYGVGYSNIDTAAAKQHGIAVTNTPEVLSECTADLAITLMLMAARRTGEGERELRAGNWSGWRPTHLRGTKVTGKTLGILGFGRIGREVAHRAHHGFGMNILAYDRFPIDPSAADQVKAKVVSSVDELLEGSDFVSLHCPGGDENRHLINAAALKRMKSGAYLINTARGEVVDETALAAALKDGTIAGAGLDVFEAEPKVTPALTECENAVLLPHLGSATNDTRDGMGMRVIANVEAFFAGREPGDRVA